MNGLRCQRAGLKTKIEARQEAGRLTRADRAMYLLVPQFHLHMRPVRWLVCWRILGELGDSAQVMRVELPGFVRRRVTCRGDQGVPLRYLPRRVYLPLVMREMKECCSFRDACTPDVGQECDNVDTAHELDNADPCSIDVALQLQSERQTRLGGRLRIIGIAQGAMQSECVRCTGSGNVDEPACPPASRGLVETGVR
jgi:hypothetical protein